jgi:SAM-dependent methyltransferase
MRRFFDPRFQGVVDHIRHQAEAFEELRTAVLATAGANTLAGRTLGEVRNLAVESQHEVSKLSGAYFRRLTEGGLVDVDEDVVALLNRETTAKSFAAEGGLYFNPPVWVGYGPGSVFVRAVNERIAENAYAFRAVAGLEPGAAILDVGATESTIALSLAALGYEVTAIDPRPYPLEHPNLTVVVGPVEDWEQQAETFDAVLCISTVEHIGVGAYDQPVEERADLKAMKRMRELTRPGGLLVLTTPFGRGRVDDFERTYDRAALDALLEGWEIEDLTVVRREDPLTWVSADSTPSEGDAEQVALVTARRA